MDYGYRDFVSLVGLYVCSNFTIGSSTIEGPVKSGLAAGQVIGFTSVWNSDGNHKWLAAILPISESGNAFVSPYHVVMDEAGNVYVAGDFRVGINWPGTRAGNMTPGIFPPGAVSPFTQPFVVKFSPTVGVKDLCMPSAACIACMTVSIVSGRRRALRFGDRCSGKGQ